MSDDYDPAEDARKCYDVAIAAKRARGDNHYPIPFSQQPWKRREFIGACTLYLGDSLQVVPTISYDTIVSDPPFGMSFRSNHREQRHEAIANDETTELLEWCCGLEAPHSKYVFCRWDNLRDIPKPKSLVTWVKNNWSMGDLEHEHARQTEVAAFYPGQGHFFPKGRPQDVISAPRTGNEFHPTEKPVQLMMAFVEWTSGTVLDPFMGSGTTGVACAKLGRNFIGIEIDEGYFNIAVDRIKKAYLQPDFFVEQAKQDQPIQEGLF